MAQRYRFARLAGDAQKTVHRIAKKTPMQAEVFVGTEHTNPDRQMGGPSQSPSVTLTVYPDGTWEVRTRKPTTYGWRSDKVAEGELVIR